MSQWKLLGSTAILAAMTGSAALAVTPEEVWAKWQDLSANYGQTMTAGSEARDGDALVVTDMTLASTQDGASMTMTVPQVRFADIGDGKVEVTLSDSYDVVLTPETGKPDEKVVLTISHPGFKTVASGEAEESRYDFTAPEIAVAIKEVTAGTDTGRADGTLKVSNAVGNYIITGDSLSSSVTADAVALNLAVEEKQGAAEPGTVKLDMTVTDIAGQSNTTLAGLMDDMAKAVAEGFASDGNLSFGTSTFTSDVTDPTGTLVLNGGGDSGSFSFNMDKGGVGYASAVKNMTVSASGSQIPFPELKISYAEGAFELLMPIVQSAEPGDFRFVTKLVDLVLPEDIWAIIDPTAQLPRDPATIILDTSGKARLTMDILNSDPAITTETVPGELNALSLNQLLLKFAGAEISGSGDLTFDNSDVETYGGIPAPEGTVSFKGVGINGFLDKLTAMGLVPEEDLMGVRMMMGMFVKIEEGQEDTMTSVLEFKDKHFSVNGMQLQ